MNVAEKLTILADSAKYDVACTSSGSNRKNLNGIGNTVPAGCCHAFSADGRCISLLKVLYTNHCIYDCKYCVNRSSNDVQRTAFTPKELSELTIEFYRRNYIEGLFLSSGVMKNADYTMEQIIKTLEILRYEYKFHGYIHAKTIPGASSDLVYRLGILADRLSVNVELPSEASLNRLAPNKDRKAIFKPMGYIATGTKQNKQELALYKHAPKFANAGQSTQMIIGASPESDYQIVKLSEGMYNKYSLKRVFYSAYIPTLEDKMLPAIDTKPPLLREHRLYQADFMLRQYHFKADEILSEENPDFNPFVDPKCNWALNNLHFFPVDVNRASFEELLRVPGIGPTSAKRIIIARRHSKLTMLNLKKIGAVLKRARFFIITADELRGIITTPEITAKTLIDPSIYSFGVEQLSLFDNAPKSIDINPHLKSEFTVAQIASDVVEASLRKHLF
ncbi:MAG: putative DNA modification/repair radical SAM protein [Defluviitaleaceae bacterium]|nr:putative DNA modification/repair radical SAM protein [Defluviitaleaceae bacterium]